MDAQTLSQMDKVSGLSGSDVSEMDQISGLGVKSVPSTPDGPTYEQYITNPTKYGNIDPKLRDQYVRQGSDKLKGAGFGVIPELLSMVTDVNTALGGGDPTKDNAYLSEQEKRDLSEHPFLNAAKGGAQAASLLLPSTIAPVAGAGIAPAAANAAINGGIKGAEYGFGSSKTGEELSKTTQDAAIGALLNVLFTGATSGMLSKKGVYGKMSDAANKADPLDWNDIADEARGQAKGKAATTQKALENLIAQEHPTPDGNLGALTEGPPNEIVHAGGLSEPKMYNYQGPLREDVPFSGLTHNIQDPRLTGQQALDLRASLGKRLPSNFFEKLLSNVGGKKTPGEDEAVDILRRAVSDKLKQASPGIVTPDKLYSIYAQMHGDVPTWAKRIFGGIVADKLVGNKFGGDVHALSDALGAVLGGAI